MFPSYYMARKNASWTREGRELHLIFNMEKESKRDQKRNSAKKAREHQIFTQKHIRLQEKNKSLKGQDKQKGT